MIKKKTLHHKETGLFKKNI